MSGRARGPIVGAGLYEAVVGRSHRMCQCDTDAPGSCGLADHPKTGWVCRRAPEPRAHLVVVPRDPEVADHVAVTLPAEALMAMCPGCYGRRRNATVKARAAGNAEAQTSLFDPTGMEVA